MPSRMVVTYFRMMFFVVLCLLYFNNVNYAQLITTVAGGGAVGLGDGGPATSAALFHPSYIAFDSENNFYFTQSLGHRIRNVSNTGTIYTVAGEGMPGFNGDGGLAVDSKINRPTGIVIDSIGNLIFADGMNNRIRKIEKSTGIITTIIGSVSGFAGDGGQAKDALLNRPESICFDAHGNLYISDLGNSRIRKVDKSGVINTICGNGIIGNDGDDGLAISASCFPWGAICVDLFDNLYFASQNYGVIRKIDKMGVIKTIAGSSMSSIYNGDNIDALSARLDPFGLVVNSESIIYVSDYFNNRIRMIKNDTITTISGNGIASSLGDNGNAKDASVNSPSGLALDTCGNLYFGQVNTPRIRKISFNPECLPLHVTDANSVVREVKVYPNPVQDELSVSSGEPIEEVALYNAVGQLVVHGAGRGQRSARLGVGQLPAGVYMVRVNGQYVNRIVKQ